MVSAAASIISAVRSTAPFAMLAAVSKTPSLAVKVSFCVEGGAGMPIRGGQFPPAHGAVRPDHHVCPYAMNVPIQRERVARLIVRP